MKKILALALASMMLISAAACGKTETAVSSTASAAETFLAERIGEIPEGVIVGDAAVAETYGVDMSAFEDDGYIIRTVGDETLVFGKTEDGLDRAVRKYAKAVQNGTAATLDEVYHEGYRIEKLTIAGRDISEYTLYYPETANENMKFAAEEMVRLVKKACGFELPVIVGDPVSPAIELRHTDDPALETDGYRYEVTEDGLVIEGAVKRGCMNGVWRFLQLECGWDFLIYGDSYLNESDHVNIPVGTARTEEPCFEYLMLWNRYDNFRNERATPTNAQNSYGTIGQAGHGIAAFYQGGNAEGAHPCYTDEAFYEETLKNIRAHVVKNYDNPALIYIGIGQNDSLGFCQCATCMEVLQEEGSNAGAILRHANFIAENINNEFPEKPVYFAIFAYAGSNVPPKVTKAHEYVSITFCFDWNCTNHKLDGSDCNDKVYFYDNNNKSYAKWVEGWCAICDNVIVYPYNLGLALNEYTVINNVYDDYRYLHEIGVVGVCLEGSAYGNFGIKRIEQVLISELNWNPDMTEEEFTEIYHLLLERDYGDGWKEVLEFIDGWEMSQDLAKCWSWWGSLDHDQSTRFFDTGFYAARFDDFVDLIDSAIYSANSNYQEEMCKRMSCLVLYKGCYSEYFMAYLEGDTERLQILSDRYDRCMNTLYELGENPEDLIVTWEGSRIHYSTTIEEMAWENEDMKWVDYFFNLTGQYLPEGLAPVINE